MRVTAQPTSPIELPARPAVVVAGMGRSGTSMVSRLCGILGMDLGDQEAMLPAVAGDNPRGYWEQTDVVALDDEILSKYGSGWWVDSRPLPDDWREHPDAPALLDRGRALLGQLYRAERPWCFKDPRASLTLPLWHHLVPELACIVCVRHPAEVARSLQTRVADLYPVDWTVRTWLRYTSAALRFTAGMPRLVVFYEDLVARPAAEVERLWEFLSGDGRRLDPWLRERAVRTVEPELRHHTVEARAIALATEVRAGWELVRAGAYDGLARLGPDLEAAIGERDRQIVHAEQLTARIEELTAGRCGPP